MGEKGTTSDERVGLARSTNDKKKQISEISRGQTLTSSLQPPLRRIVANHFARSLNRQTAGKQRFKPGNGNLKRNPYFEVECNNRETRTDQQIRCSTEVIFKERDGHRGS